jgi:hypothetical protein
MILDTFLADYAGHILASFGFGFGTSLLFTYAKKYIEQI